MSARRPCPPRRPPPPRAAGTTLLELIVAIAIFAVVAAIAFGGLQTLLATRRSADEQMAWLATAQKAFSLLQQDLTQVTARTIRDAQGDRQPALVGTPGTGQQLELTRAGALDPAQPRTPRLLRVGYRLEDGRLVRSLWSVLDRAPDSEAREAVLLEALDGLTVRYLNGTGDWVAHWPDGASPAGAAQLPLAVEVTAHWARWGTIRRLFPLPQTGGSSGG